MKTFYIHVVEIGCWKTFTTRRIIFQVNFYIFYIFYTTERTVVNAIFIFTQLKFYTTINVIFVFFMFYIIERAPA